MFSSHCLERNLDKMLELWTEIFDRVSFRDTERLTTLIRMSAAEQAAMLSHSGHNYAMSHSASSLTPAAKQNEVFGGVTQVRAFQNMYYMNNIIITEVFKMMEPMGAHWIKCWPAYLVVQS